MLHVIRHDGRAMLRDFIPLVGQGADINVVHVAMTGTWEGHPAGPFEFTEEVFDQLVSRFERQRNPMPVDYEHASMDIQPHGAPAAGWVQQLFRDGKNLFARVEWTPRAAEMIKQGEYRFCSPVIDFEAVDRKTGEEVGVEMFNLALTNNPFLDGQRPIMLTRRGQAKGRSMTKKKLSKAVIDGVVSHPLAKRYGLRAIDVQDIADKLVENFDDAEVDAEQVVQAVMGLVEAMQAQQPPEESGGDVPQEQPPPSDAPMSEGTEGTVELQEDGELAAGAEAMSLLMQATGLEEAAVLEALRSKVDQVAAVLNETASEDGTPAEEGVAASLRRERDELALKLVQLRHGQQQQEEQVAQETEKQKRTRQVNDMIERGYILEAERKLYMSMGREHFNQMVKLAQDRPRVPVQNQASEEDDTPPANDPQSQVAALSDREKRLYRMLIGDPKIDHGKAMKYIEQRRN